MNLTRHVWFLYASAQAARQLKTPTAVDRGEVAGSAPSESPSARVFLSRVCRRACCKVGGAELPVGCAKLLCGDGRGIGESSVRRGNVGAGGGEAHRGWRKRWARELGGGHASTAACREADL